MHARNLSYPAVARAEKGLLHYYDRLGAGVNYTTARAPQDPTCVSADAPAAHHDKVYTFVLSKVARAHRNIVLP